MRYRIYPWLMVAMYLVIVPKAVLEAFTQRGYPAFGGEWLLPIVVILLIEMIHGILEVVLYEIKEWKK